MTPQQIDQLYKLGRLKQDGMITEDEFDAESKRIKEWAYELNPNNPYAANEGWASLPLNYSLAAESQAIINILLRIESQLLMTEKEKIWNDYTEIRRRLGWYIADVYQVHQEEEISNKDSCTAALAQLKNDEIVSQDEASDLLLRIIKKFPDVVELPDQEMQHKQALFQESMECFDAMMLLKDKGLVDSEEYISISTKMMDKYPRK